jgi:hypothetical protein
MAGKKKRTGEYFYHRDDLVKRRDVIEAAPREKTWFEWAEEFISGAKRAQMRRTQVDEVWIEIDTGDPEALGATAKEPGSENVCHVEGCVGLIADPDISLFCCVHNLRSFIEGWAERFPPPGFVPETPSRPTRRGRRSPGGSRGKPKR